MVRSVTNLAWLQKVNEGVLQVPLHLQLLNESPPAARKPEHLTRSATAGSAVGTPALARAPCEGVAYGAEYRSCNAVQQRHAPCQTASREVDLSQGTQEAQTTAEVPQQQAGVLPQVCQPCMERSGACPALPVLTVQPRGLSLHTTAILAAMGACL